MNILITGVAGLLGSRFADYITQNTPHTVIGVDDLSGGYVDNVNSDVIFYSQNLSIDKESNQKLHDIFEEHRPDYVYHFAAYAAEGLSPFIRRFNYTNNLVSTANVVNNCINYDTVKWTFKLQATNTDWIGASLDRIMFTERNKIFGTGIEMFWVYGCISI